MQARHLSILETLSRTLGYPPTFREFMSAAGLRSNNAAFEAMGRLQRRGRISYRRNGARTPSRTLVILSPLTRSERLEHGLPAFETAGSYDTGYNCITCHVAHVFDGIIECLECRAVCDKSLPG